MIDKREILAIAQQTSLTPHVVEKDYVLGWMLAGIYGHEGLAESWIYKDGTCLKKCFFETYRFSEDLDFTLREPQHLDANFLQDVFSEIGEWIYDQTGIEIPADKHEFDIYENPRGQISCQGKISRRCTELGSAWSVTVRPWSIRSADCCSTEALPSPRASLERAG